MNKSLLFALGFSLLSSTAYCADLEAGKAKSTTCAGCHGASGISAIPQYPNLAGQKEAYLKKQLMDFRGDNRQDPVMSAMAKALSDTDIENLSAFYASLDK